MAPASIRDIEVRAINELGVGAGEGEGIGGRSRRVGEIKQVGGGAAGAVAAEEHAVGLRTARVGLGEGGNGAGTNVAGIQHTPDGRGIQLAEVEDIARIGAGTRVLGAVGAEIGHGSGIAEGARAVVDAGAGELEIGARISECTGAAVVAGRRNIDVITSEASADVGW